MDTSERVSKMRFNPAWFQPEESYFSSTTTFNPIMQPPQQHALNLINRPATSSSYNGTKSRWLEDIPKSGMKDTEKLTELAFGYNVSPQSHTMRTASPTPLDTLCEELQKRQQNRLSCQITNVEIWTVQIQHSICRLLLPKWNNFILILLWHFYISCKVMWSII